MKLIIIDHGDPSVGIFPMNYEVDTPIDKDSDVDDRTWFKKQLTLLYKEFAEGRLTLDFEDEIETENKMMEHLGI